MDPMNIKNDRCSQKQCRGSYQYEEDDLIIEENTIYEIDLDCYECLMREKKRVLDKNKI